MNEVEEWGNLLSTFDYNNKYGSLLQGIAEMESKKMDRYYYRYEVIYLSWKGYERYICDAESSKEARKMCHENMGVTYKNILSAERLEKGSMIKN